MNYDTLQTLDKKTKDRRLFRWKVLSASLLLLLLTLIGWTLYLYYGYFPKDCNLKVFPYENCTMKYNFTNSEASPNFIWYRTGYKPCREGWNFNDKSCGCYYISNIPLTWTDANEFCRQMSSCLTNILSREDMNWIGNIANDSAWLGGWVGGSQNGQVYQWECQQYNYHKQISSNSPLWANGEPKPVNTTQCVQIYKLQTGFWLDDHPCSYLKRFVCTSVPLIK